MPRSPKRCRWLCTVCSRYNDPECEVCELATCRLSKRVVGITVSSPKATRRGPRYDKAPKGAVPLSAAPHTVSRRTKPAEEPEAAPRTKRVKRVHGDPSSSNQDVQAPHVCLLKQVKEPTFENSPNSNPI